MAEVHFSLDAEDRKSTLNDFVEIRKFHIIYKL